METCDKKDWLNNQGNYITKVQYTPEGKYWVRWQSYGGHFISAYGRSRDALYDNLYEAIKERLMFRCKHGT